MRRALIDVIRGARIARSALRWGLVPLILLVLRRPQDPAALGVRLRRFMEELGITFVKIGQYLAIRSDLLPDEICREMSKLFSETPPMDFGTVRHLVETELGAPLEERFDDFDPEPIGAASIAQAHKAVAKDGDVLAVKVQRPNVEADLLADIRNLRRVARIADQFHVLGEMSLLRLIDEVAEFTLREIDFETEGRTADRLELDSLPGAYVPRVRWDLTTRRVLSLEFIDGISLREFCDSRNVIEVGGAQVLLPGTDIERIIGLLTESCLHQLFITGFFHGDPHPENILIKRDGTIAFIDFGIFGDLSSDECQVLRNYIENLAIGNFEEAYLNNLDLNELSSDTDVAGYRRELTDVMRRWRRSASDGHFRPSQQIVATYQGQVLGVMRRHGVRMHSGQLLFWRALAILDATAHRLPIDFNLLQALEDFFFRHRSPLWGRTTDFLGSNLQRLGDLAALEISPQHRWLVEFSRKPVYQLQVEAHNPRHERRTVGERTRPFALVLLVLALAIAIQGLVDIWPIAKVLPGLD